MKFIDEAVIQIHAGHGGRGCVSFRREKYVPRGGPNGGNGGVGGSVYFVATEQLSTLQDFRFRRVYQAGNGEPGMGSDMTGADGKDIEIRIPVGTVVKDSETGEALHDFTLPGERWLAAAGGRGGKGNAHFVSSTFQAPKFAQPGEDGEHHSLSLELKLLADVALIGFPNAGKSTLISKISAARPKIADYPFTTLTPHLGVVSRGMGHSYVVADIPGLIEGASEGAGLGDRFLKHIERTRILVHVLDGSKLLDPELGNLLDDYKIIRKELQNYNSELLERPEIIALNKVDLLQDQASLVAAFTKELQSVTGHKRAPLVLSGVTGKGLDSLLKSLDEILIEPTQNAQGLTTRQVVLPDGSLSEEQA